MRLELLDDAFVSSNNRFIIRSKFLLMFTKVFTGSKARNNRTWKWPAYGSSYMRKARYNSVRTHMGKASGMAKAFGVPRASVH